MNRLCILALLGLASAAAAQELPPEFGRYRSMYPGRYLHAAVGSDDRDSAFDARGERRNTAAPNGGGSTAFPERFGVAQVEWHFPMFETYGLPFFSSRLHTARARLRWVDTRTEGALARFAADPGDDARTEADDLRNAGKGIGDLTLEMGSFLYGSENWRTRDTVPLSVLLLGSVNIPGGVYDRDAPINAGSNVWHFEARLGAHAMPWTGTLLDAGVAFRDYGLNREPAFGGLAPEHPGDEWAFDAGIAQRLLPDLYLGASYQRRDGDPNTYRNPRYAPNAPPHPGPATDTYPAPGHYRDGGTSLETLGASLSWFMTQRWQLALHWLRPVRGRSGEFDLPFDERSPSGCIPGSDGCVTMAGETVTVDGLGEARRYASDRLMLSVTHNFGLGDTFSCTGCER